MSEIRIQCRSCSQELALPYSAAGKQAKCPQCAAVFEVQAPVGSPVKASVTTANPYSSPALKESTNVHSDFKSGPSKGASPYDDHNPPPLGLMTIPLYISAVIYLVIGVGAIAFLLYAFGAANQSIPFFLLGIWMFFALLSCALAGFIFFFTGKLRQRKKWAWITAIAFGGLYTPSAFIFMGVPILIGALKPEVQAWFNTD